jgi:hypothetical protein
VSKAPHLDATVCSVCGGLLESHTSAACNTCGKAYHLNQRQDMAGQDCGQVWINDEHMALEFACDNCLNPPPASLDEVLDLEEAAAEASVTVGVLEAAAIAGEIRHRRTAGGLLLFTRSDLRAYAGPAR